MKIPERLQNIIDKGKQLTRKQLETYKYSLFFLIVVDLVGIYYFLHATRIGLTLIVVFLIALGFIMFLESKLPKEEVKEEKKEQKPDENERIPSGAKRIIKKEKEGKKMAKEETTEEEQDNDFGFGSLGLPNADEFNERVSKAFEFKGF